MRIAFASGSLGRKTALAAITVSFALTVTAAEAEGRWRTGSAAIIVDGNTGKVLYSDNPDELRHPASLTKVMTLYLLFEQLEAGKIRLNTPMEVSAKAASQSPSKLGVRAGSTIEVEDAIKALVTRSANDCAVVIAEAIGGTEANFARMMTQKARGLGMSRTTFRNANGLPNADQVTTARDYAILGRAIQERFPKYYKYFSTRVFYYRGQAIGNHNRLLGRIEGVDGIKTGYTRASGFNLVTSVHRDDRFLIGVVLGGRSARARDGRMADLISSHLPRAYAGRKSVPNIVEVASRSMDRDVPLPDPVEREDEGESYTPETVAAASGSAPNSAPLPKPAPQRLAAADPIVTAAIPPRPEPRPDSAPVKAGLLAARLPEARPAEIKTADAKPVEAGLAQNDDAKPADTVALAYAGPDTAVSFPSPAERRTAKAATRAPKPGSTEPLHPVKVKMAAMSSTADISRAALLGFAPPSGVLGFAGPAQVAMAQPARKTSNTQVADASGRIGARTRTPVAQATVQATVQAPAQAPAPVASASAPPSEKDNSRHSASVSLAQAAGLAGQVNAYAGDGARPENPLRNEPTRRQAARIAQAPIQPDAQAADTKAPDTKASTRTASAASENFFLEPIDEMEQEALHPREATRTQASRTAEKPPKNNDRAEVRTPPRSGWMIQIGAFDAEKDARSKLDLAKAKARSLLGDAEPYTEKVSKGSGNLYRARFAGLDEKSAKKACRLLKSNDFDCMTIRN